MKYAVMQPYLFPYLGYYQLVNSVDKFVFYDDVTYIKGGYINRNNILSNGNSQRFTVPVIGASSNKKICELEFGSNVLKIKKSIKQAYSRAPYFSEIYPIIVAVLDSEERDVTKLCRASIEGVFDYLGITISTLISSEMIYNKEQGPVKRLIDMSRVLECDYYINTIGGKDLYDKKEFIQHGITLDFIKPNDFMYIQGESEVHIPNLSIIDVLMWNSKEEIISMLDEYHLI